MQNQPVQLHPQIKPNTARAVIPPSWRPAELNAGHVSSSSTYEPDTDAAGLKPQLRASTGMTCAEMPADPTVSPQADYFRFQMSNRPSRTAASCHPASGQR